MGRNDLYDKLRIDPEIFEKFAKRIQNGYTEVAYHNQIHASDVCQTTYHILTKGELIVKANLTDIDIASLLIASICHDFEHL
jgi:hypothetical protein